MTWTSSSTLNSQYFMYHGRCQVHVIVCNKAVPVTGLAQNSSQALHQAQWHVVRKVANILVFMICTMGTWILHNGYVALHNGYVDFAQWAGGFTQRHVDFAQWACDFTQLASVFCAMGM